MTHEQEEAQARARNRRNAIAFGAMLLVAAAIAGVAVAVTSGGGDDSDDPGQAYANNSVPAGAEVGAQTTPPPWQPEYAHLRNVSKRWGSPV